MDQYLLAELSEKLKIAPLNIIREEAEMLLLYCISQSPLAEKIIFYGGTALRLAYNCPRFSEDIDFLQIRSISASALKGVLNAAIDSDPNLSIDDLKEKYHTLFARIKIRSSLLKHPLHVKIEISKRKNGIKSEFRPLASPCSSLQPTLYTADLESLKSAKIRALKDRNTPRDWFDLWYLNKILKTEADFAAEFRLDRTEYKREMKRYIPKNKWKLIDESIK